MTTLYPATSATSRAGIASAIQGRRPKCQSRITAASISRRSASGSAILPKADSTCQLRASQPSIWSVIAAAPNRIAAGQLWPSSVASRSPTKTGMTARRAIVSAFGIWAKGAGTARVAMLTGYGGGRDAQPAGVRERPQPRVPAGLAGPNGRWRLLGVARVHAGPGRGTVPRTGPSGLRPGLPRAGRGGLHGGRRVPLPRPAGGASGRRSRGRGWDRAGAPDRRLWTRRARALPSGVAGGLSLAAGGGA